MRISILVDRWRTRSGYLVGEHAGVGERVDSRRPLNPRYSLRRAPRVRPHGRFAGRDARGSRRSWRRPRSRPRQCPQPPRSTLAGSLVCHQRPERSFHRDGAQFPVCARCLGLYAGGWLGVLAWAVLAGLGREASRRAQRLSRHARLVLVALAVPTLVSLAAARLGSWDASNTARALLAVPLGAAHRRARRRRGRGRPEVDLRPCGPPPPIACSPSIPRSSPSPPGSFRALGHLWQGRTQKGAVFLVAIPLMFADRALAQRPAVSVRVFAAAGGAGGVCQPRQRPAVLHRDAARPRGRAS